MHQVAPNYTNLYQVAPNCTKLQQSALSCTNLHKWHQLAPNGTNLHQVAVTAPRCTKLYQSAPSCTNLHKVPASCTKLHPPICSKLHQSAVEDYETSFRLLLNYILLNLLCYRILHTSRLSGILSFFWSQESTTNSRTSTTCCVLWQQIDVEELLHKAKLPTLYTRRL